MIHATLGLSSYVHDSAAALLVGGELVGAIEEERLSGVKHTNAFPVNAIRWLLSEAGMAWQDVSLVAYNYDPQLYAIPDMTQLGNHRSPISPKRKAQRAAGFSKVREGTALRIRDLQSRFPSARIEAWRHHLTHARYAAEMLDGDVGTILVVDSLGEVEASTAWLARREGDQWRLTCVLVNEDPNSLGYVYASTTQYLGYQRNNEEGTVMALAALGDRSRYRDLMVRAVALTATGIEVNPQYFLPRTLLPGANRMGPVFLAETGAAGDARPAGQAAADLAAALQERTEDALIHLARIACERTQSGHLVVSGGVALNCVAIGKLAEEPYVDSISVPPAPGDSGTAVGAALLSSGLGTTASVRQYATGPRCSVSDLENARNVLSPHATDAGPASPRAIAQLLATGKLVGVCRDRAEFGPRALGNRSILANPLVERVTEVLNSRVKHREAFRPFAPAVLSFAASDWFDLVGRWPYMSAAFRATRRASEVVPEVVHANNLSRVQTVDPDTSPFFHATILEFSRLTSVPLLINTSLNVKGQPMSGTASAAVSCFLNGSLDAICLEDRIYARR
ncbi:MAG: carbamoyltransferase C-terminal domain-containing protein [Micropruina sp.]|uniref:carbamoyltransferase family protein n=1 Tax=Micropruina sp. TaxID=2737536 RepID=UPI0039E3A7F5